MTGRPQGSQPHYGEHLGDARYWEPYVKEVLRRHDLPDARLESGFVGTFPTFLAGDVVVKLFGPSFDGEEAFEVECAVHEAVTAAPAIPAPEIVACGSLYGDDPKWPYVVQQRVGGVAVRDAALTPDERRDVAMQLGEVVRVLHSLPAPVFRTGLLDDLRRVPRRRKSLPDHLLTQIPAYLEDALPASTFVHGDITADHVYVSGRRLVALIDWGDALLADPYYELVPVFFDALGRDRDAAHGFLEAYGWAADEDFDRRLLQACLGFQFDAFHGVDTSGVDTLDELTSRIWAH